MKEIILLTDREKVLTDKYYPWIYFHGKLEDDLGYDIVHEKENENFSLEIDSLKTGESKIVEVKVLVEGILKEALAYIWKVSVPYERTVGLVCYKDDKKYNEDALLKQKELRTQL